MGGGIIHLERRKLLIFDMAELEPQIAGTKRFRKFSVT